jgi:hypothetical protein
MRDSGLFVTAGVTVALPLAAAFAVPRPVEAYSRGSQNH